jgi:hypothetical protein
MDLEKQTVDDRGLSFPVVNEERREQRWSETLSGLDR